MSSSSPELATPGQAEILLQALRTLVGSAALSGSMREEVTSRLLLPEELPAQTRERLIAAMGKFGNYRLANSDIEAIAELPARAGSGALATLSFILTDNRPIAFDNIDIEDLFAEDEERESPGLDLLDDADEADPGYMPASQATVCEYRIVKTPEGLALLRNIINNEDIELLRSSGISIESLLPVSPAPCTAVPSRQVLPSATREEADQLIVFAAHFPR